MKKKVEDELNRLIRDNIIYSVESSEWATPVVPILKSTLNTNLKIYKYPIPRVQDLLSTLNGGIMFSTIDLSRACQQVELEKNSQLLTTISTHKGLYAYKRLCFGVASAPGLFQRRMEQILAGIDGVVSFVDDILISGSTKKDHDERLEKVLMRLRDAGLTARSEKYQVFGF